MIDKYPLTDAWKPSSAPDSLHLAGVCITVAIVLEREDTLAASCGAIHSGAGGGGGGGGGGLLGQAGRAAVPPVTLHVVPKDIRGCGAPWLVKPSICCARGVGNPLVGEREDTRKTNLGPTISQALPSRGGCCGGSSYYDDSWGGGG